MKPLRTLLVLVVVFSSWGVSEEASGRRISDQEFRALLDELTYHRSSTLFEIAYSGHPKALEVLKILESRPAGWKWEDVKKRYGFPDVLPSEGTIYFSKKALEVPLAAAGDEEAFQRLINEFEAAKGKGGFNRDELRKIAKVRTDRAVRYVASLLDRDDEFWNGERLPQRAAEALHEMGLENAPDDEAYWRAGTTESLQKLVQVWREWWKENAGKYGAEVAEAEDVGELAANRAIDLDADSGKVPAALVSDETQAAGEEAKGEAGLVPWPWLMGVAGILVIVAGLLFARRRAG